MKEFLKKYFIIFICLLCLCGCSKADHSSLLANRTKEALKAFAKYQDINEWTLTFKKKFDVASLRYCGEDNDENNYKIILSGTLYEGTAMKQEKRFCYFVYDDHKIEEIGEWDFKVIEMEYNPTDDNKKQIRDYNTFMISNVLDIIGLDALYCEW